MKAASSNIPPTHATAGCAPDSTAFADEFRQTPRAALGDLAKAFELQHVRREGCQAVAADLAAVKRARYVTQRRLFEELAGHAGFARLAFLNVVFGMHHDRERFTHQPKRTAFIAEQVPPAAERAAVQRVGAVHYRTGSCDHHDARFSAERAGVRHRCVVHHHEARRPQVRRLSEDSAFVAADAGNDRCEVRIRRQPGGVQCVGECERECIAQARRGLTDADLVRGSGNAAPDDASRLVADHRDRRTLSAVDAGDERAHTFCRRSPRAKSFAAISRATRSGSTTISPSRSR